METAIRVFRVPGLEVVEFSMTYKIPESGVRLTDETRFLLVEMRQRSDNLWRGAIDKNRLTSIGQLKKALQVRTVQFRAATSAF